MPAPAFTTRVANQAHRFAVIDAFFAENRRVPTYRELCELLGFASKRAGWLVVQGLVSTGAIIRRPTPDGSFILVPAGRRVSNKRGKPGSRLPQTRKASDNGLIYVVQRGSAHKIGFTRNGLARRVRDSGGVLVLTIPVAQRPAQFEYLLNNRFGDKRLPAQGNNAGDKREWFALTDTDLEWLRGLASFIGGTV